MDKRSGIHDPVPYSLSLEIVEQLVHRELRQVEKIHLAGWISLTMSETFKDIGGTLQGQTWTPPPDSILNQLVPNEGFEPKLGDTIRAAYHLSLENGDEFVIAQVMCWSCETLEVYATKVRITPPLV